MKQYWLVGAMFGGKHDALEMFLRRGYWYCWEPSDILVKAIIGDFDLLINS